MLQGRDHSCQQGLNEHIRICGRDQVILALISSDNGEHTAARAVGTRLCVGPRAHARGGESGDSNAARYFRNRCICCIDNDVARVCVVVLKIRQGDRQGGEGGGERGPTKEVRTAAPREYTA